MLSHSVFSRPVPTNSNWPSIASHSIKGVSPLGQLLHFAASEQIFWRMIFGPEFEVPSSPLARAVFFASVEKCLSYKYYSLSEFPYQSAPIDSRDEPLFSRLERCDHGLTVETCVLCKGRNNPDYFAPKRPSRFMVMGTWMTFVYPPTPSPAPPKGTIKEYVKCAYPLLEPDYLHRVEPKATPYNSAWNTLREKALASTFTGFTNWCATCFEYVAGISGPCHNCDEFQAKKVLGAKKKEANVLAEWRLAAAMITKQRRASEQLRLDALFAQGLTYWQSEQHDLDIIEERIAGDTPEAITEFDKQMWNKSARAKCKWRIR